MAPRSPFSACPACSLACGEDQNDTIKNESSPASGFISYRKDTSDFFFPQRTQISHHFLLKTLHSVPAHKHKLKANRHSPQTSATCLILAKVSPSLSGFLVSSALELALIPADWHSGSLVCALLSTQCPRKAFPVLRSIGGRGRGLQRVAPDALKSPPERIPRSIKTLSAPQFPHLQKLMNLFLSGR